MTNETNAVELAKETLEAYAAWETLTLISNDDITPEQFAKRPTLTHHIRDAAPVLASHVLAQADEIARLRAALEAIANGANSQAVSNMAKWALAPKGDDDET